MLVKKRHQLSEQMRLMQKDYEKKLFDAKQLVEISKSLNSNLDYNNLVQSILYICMGQLKVLKAGLFARKEIDKQHLYLHRSIVGFDIDHSVDYIISEDHILLAYFQENFRCHTFEELLSACPEVKNLGALAILEPYLVVPMRSKSMINGILVLGDPIEGTKITQDERDYVMDITTLAGIAVHNAFLYEVTTTDIMTKLKLRHFFIDVLQDHMVHARQEKYPLSLVMIDIDHFKDLNDTYGHVCGDEVIKQVCSVILGNVRQTDLAARYGGEEFVLLLPDTETNAAFTISERIRATIADNDFVYNDQPISLTVSMGVVEYNANIDVNTHTFIDRADSAMYDSKHAGRNKVSIAHPSGQKTTI